MATFSVVSRKRRLRRRSFPHKKLDSAISRPNIIIILTDDQRYDAMGFVNPDLSTPNIDALARNGLHFSNAFVTTSLCSPSRATLLTGRPMREHGVVDNNSDLAAAAGYIPSGAATRRVQDGIDRQMAFGRRQRGTTPWLR